MSAANGSSIRITGLAVAACDLELPGFLATSPQDGEPDVVIRSAPTPQALDGAQASGPTWAMRPGRFLLRVPGMVRFLLRDGAAIDYEAEANAQPGDLAAFVIGAAFGLLLHQRGLVTVQASSVCVKGKAVLFLGASGVGKSTLAAALLRPPLARRRLQRPQPRRPGRAAGASGWRPAEAVEPEAIDALGLAESCASPVRRQLLKFRVVRRGGFTAPMPLGPAYALRDARPPRKPGIQRPNVVDSALIIRGTAYRPGVVRRLQQAQLYFQVAQPWATAWPSSILTRSRLCRAGPDDRRARGALARVPAVDVAGAG